MKPWIQSALGALALAIVITLDLCACGPTGASRAAEERWEAPSFAFRDQHGAPLSDQSLRGQVWIADFFFTRCTSICPGLTARFVLLQSELDAPGLRFVSFSVDPGHDTPEVLARYAQQWNPGEARWLLASTTPEGLARTAEGLRVAVHATGDVRDPIFHSNHFLLVDQQGRVRGSYDSEDEQALAELRAAARRLGNEKDAQQLAARDGKTLFTSLGCAACHADARLAPPLGGLLGREVALDGGKTVTADLAYLEQSILDPWALLVAGYGPTMPRYSGHLDARELQALVTYVGSGELHAGGAPQASAPAAQQETDPICNMKVTVTADTPSARYEGRSYWFCCESCRERFAADPKRYAATAPPPAPKEPAAEQGSLAPGEHIQVAFVIDAGAEVVDFAGPWGVFEYAHVEGREDSPFQLFIVAESKQPLKVSGGMTVVPDYTFSDAPAPKLVVIPALGGEPSPALLEWVQRTAKQAQLTLSVCNGSFVLGAAGLLSGKTATAHHGAFGFFAATFPDVKLKRGARYVDSGNVATAGGLTSGIDLALHVVERFFGRAAAERTATDLEYQGQGWKDPDSNTAFGKRPVSTAEHPICPVCEMELHGQGTLKSEFRGRSYGFCSEGCKKLFDRTPERFVDP